MKKSFYLTTTLPYVNADPHIGFAWELVQADILARWKIKEGLEVFFNTGTDEHGTKIYRKAIEEGKDPQKYVDEYAEKFKSLKKKLGLHESLQFVRTTEERHVRAAQELWRLCMEKGDIYKKKYKGLYCIGDEAFIKEIDLVNGRCPNHPNLELQEIEEENYFFKLSNYKDKLREYLSKDSVVPDWRRDEALSMTENMEDFSISREKTRLTWGVPVPGDETQVMYVWFDALTSYISTLGWPGGENFKKFWEEGQTLQIAGKDQVKFQSVIWQAMLMSGGVKNTDKVFYHGFINSGGQKMSKSLGNVLNPDDLIKKYGLEATRYLLLRHVHPFEDTDVTWEKLDEWYTADLVNGIGNLVSRVMKMAEDNLGNAVEVNSEVNKNGKLITEINEKLSEFRFQDALGIILAKVGALDLEIQNTQPFKLIKSDPEGAKNIITNLVTELSGIALELEIFMPETSKKILIAIGANKKPDNLFPRLD
ncbi:methionine--tRNA ligase [Candidatus Parcubacteria bacterium]|nr:methionine--tRNA ligase [Candidatus Parcubacteria bacterium]